MVRPVLPFEWNRIRSSSQLRRFQTEWPAWYGPEVEEWRFHRTAATVASGRLRTSGALVSLVVGTESARIALLVLLTWDEHLHDEACYEYTLSEGPSLCGSLEEGSERPGHGLGAPHQFVL